MLDRIIHLGGILVTGTDDRVVTPTNPLIINQPSPTYGTVEIQPGGDILTQVETTVKIKKLLRVPDPQERGVED